MKIKLQKFLKLMKKQLAFVICAVVVLAAIGLSYWPTQGWFADLQSKVGQSLATGSQLDGLLTKHRLLPNVNIDSTTQEPLPFFPTQDVIDVGKRAVGEVQAESTQLLQEAVTYNIHRPLVDNALPAGDDIERATFGRAYLAAMSDDSRIRNWPPPEVATARPDFPIPPLMADRRVSDADVVDALAKLQIDINNQYLAHDATGNVTQDSQTAATNAYAAQSLKKPFEMAVARAHKCKVYLETGAIKQPAIYINFANATSSLAASDIWTAQLFLWVDEDVASAVALANARATDVTNSPVKQILDVQVKDPPYVISGDPTAGKDDAALTSVPDLTPSGRVCNGMYDVVQCSITLDVEADRVPEILDSLQTGQFFTILSMQAQAIDSTDMAIQRFVYGKSPVVRLTLVCEDLFMHAWADKYAPPGAGASKYAAAAGGSPASPSSVLMTITTHQ